MGVTVEVSLGTAVSVTVGITGVSVTMGGVEVTLGTGVSDPVGVGVAVSVPVGV